MVEAGLRGPGGEGGFAELGEAFLETFEDVAGVGIARGYGAAGAGVAAFKTDFADGEPDGAAFVGAKELIFPEGGDTVDFESGAEAEAEVVEGEALKPRGDGLEGCAGDDGGAAGDGVVGETVLGIADDDLLVEEDAEPFGGFFVGFGEGEGARGNFATVAGDGERDGTDVGGIAGADEMDDGGAFAVDPFAVDGVEGPGAVVNEAAGRRDAGFGNFDGVEGFNGMEADVG